MKAPICFGEKLQHLCSGLCIKVSFFCRSTSFLLLYFFHHVVLFMNPLSIHLLYFLTISFLGFWILKVLNPRYADSFRPKSLDLFFTSVSASTVSSMSTVEMEVFSNTQLVILTILMFIGGEVFTSMVGLHLWKFKLRRIRKSENKVNSSSYDLSPPSNFPNHHQIELGTMVNTTTLEDSERSDDFSLELEGGVNSPTESLDKSLKYKSIKFLSFVVLGYLLVIHTLGVAFLSLYLNLVSSARDVLKNKGLKLFTFSVFTVVSTFASCGFVPTNENMIVFRKNSGILLLLIPQVLLGNTLFPSCLRFSVWVLGKFVKKKESNFLLKNTREIEYLHLLPSLHSSLLVVTVLGFIVVQFILFCSLEWNSAGLRGLNSYRKVVGVLFQAVNSRHTGETIVDLSTISPAIVVLFVVMMYLPPYTSFLPNKHDEPCEKKKKKRREKLVENLLFSQLSYLVIFIIVICITERKKMKEDRLNFNVLNIVVEVISAYGNVGFSMGYSCDRLLKPDDSCVNKWYGFSGKWSNEGKIVLILVMFFGRLKKFNMDGGQAWKLL